ncbi:hypothetical protein J2P12_06190 [Candidatus Bathyarchaeota archaeon]|nr:hypothetical protein [Candidatus Bathyarchaeota archaeon]
MEWSLIQRRDTTRLIYEILNLAERGASKYRIVSAVSLNFRQIERYMRFLLHSGHLEFSLNSQGVQTYTLTAKGRRLQNLLREIQEELNNLFTRSLSSHKQSISRIQEVLLTEEVQHQPS